MKKSKQMLIILLSIVVILTSCGSNTTPLQINISNSATVGTALMLNIKNNGIKQIMQEDGFTKAVLSLSNSEIKLNGNVKYRINNNIKSYIFYTNDKDVMLTVVKIPKQDSIVNIIRLSDKTNEYYAADLDDLTTYAV